MSDARRPYDSLRLNSVMRKRRGVLAARIAATQWRRIPEPSLVRKVRQRFPVDGTVHASRDAGRVHVTDSVTDSRAELD